MTSDLAGRVWQHKTGAVPGFTRDHGCKLLVWYEAYDDLQEARFTRVADEKTEAAAEAQHDRRD